MCYLRKHNNIIIKGNISVELYVLPLVLSALKNTILNKYFLLFRKKSYTLWRIYCNIFSGNTLQANNKMKVKFKIIKEYIKN